MKVWSILEEGLAHADEADLNEARLLKLVGTARAAAEAEKLPPETVTHLDRNLHRAVYEYLLALDAATSAETAPGGAAGVEPSTPQIPIAGDAPMIGIEEVTEMGRTTTVPPPMQAENHQDLIRSASAAVDSAEAQEAADSAHHRHRFGLFRRNAKIDEPAPNGDQEDEESQQFAVASRDGFHIGDPTDLAKQPAELAPDSAIAIEPLSEPQSVDSVSPVVPASPAPEAATPDPPTPTAGADITQARRAIDDRLRRKHCDEAAALLQQLAHEVGGREVAELAVDAGDRCRGLGKRRAATNSYLAAARSDPVFPTPLLRLADICIDDKDIDLAVSYMERVARLSRLSGDLEGALRVYRKIAAVAPYREDILELLLRAQTTGRIDS
jgi:tetratricopeptide (TPR) repeat protein